MRRVLLVLLVAVVSLANASAQSAPPEPSLSVSPEAGNQAALHQVIAHNLPLDAQGLVLLFSPSGDQWMLHGQIDASGTLSMPLAPPPGLWQKGFYRVVIPLPDGRAISAPFVADDGAPHLYAGPYLPSPTSAFSFVGTAFPAGSQVALTLTLTGGLGSHVILVKTDANGVFTAYAWPEEFGLAFFPAGTYEIDAPSLGLSVRYIVREHPNSASIAVQGPVVAGTFMQASFSHYAANRYLWGVYGDLDGKVTGEFLVGPTDMTGHLGAAVLASPNLTDGRYFMATPYDWGETTFQALAPTATPTLTPTVTATPTETATATDTPTPHPSKRSCKRAKGKKTRSKKRCKR